MGRWAGLPPRRDWVTTPTSYRLISFIPFPFHWETSSYDLFFGVRAWKAGTDDQIALYLSSCSCLFMKWKIHFWSWSSMLICIVWRKSGFGRSLTILGICRNTLNARWTWPNESSASAAFVLALLSVLYRVWSRQGCCSSGRTRSPSSFFGHSWENQTCHSRWCRWIYLGQSPSDAAQIGLKRLKLPSAQKML